MTSPLALCVAAAVGLACGAATAQSAQSARPAVAAAPLPAVQDTPPTQEPAVQRVVIEDEQARIEELRVRGLTQRIVVKPKHGAEYQIVPAAGGRDPSQNHANASPGAGGQRVWNFFQF